MTGAIYLSPACVGRTSVRSVTDTPWREDADPVKPGATVRALNARQADRVITTLSILLSYAVNPPGWRDDNPAMKPRRLKTDSDGYRPWTEAEFAHFIGRSDPDWQFNALFGLLSGQRGQNQVAMGWTDYDGHQLHVVQKRVAARSSCGSKLTRC